VYFCTGRSYFKNLESMSDKLWEFINSIWTFLELQWSF